MTRSVEEIFRVTDLHRPGCKSHRGEEWSGTPRDDDSGWDCDDCGVFVPATEQEFAL